MTPFEIVQITASSCFNPSPSPSGVVFRDVWGLGADGNVYLWDYNTASWKEWKA